MSKSMYYIRLPRRSTNGSINNRSIKKNVLTNQSLQMLILGICLGLTIGIVFLSTNNSGSGKVTNCQFSYHAAREEQNLISTTTEKALLKVHMENQKSSVSSSSYNFSSRPKFVSTELGIRSNKLLVGLLVSSNPDAINRILMINQTIGRFIHNQFVLFTVTSNSSSETQSKIFLEQYGFQVHNIFVPNTGRNTDIIYIKILEYFYNKSIKDKHLASYDYYYIGTDNYYINARLLVLKLKSISIGNDRMMWGIPKDPMMGQENLFNCDLGKASSNLQILWSTCTPYAFQFPESGFVLSYDTIEFYGRQKCGENGKLCGIPGHCQNIVQAQEYTSTKKSNENHDSESQSEDSSSLRLPDLITIGPISKSSKMKELHFTLSKYHLKQINQNIQTLQSQIQSLNIKGKLPTANREFSTWPIGIGKLPNIPKSRWDVNTWSFFSGDENLYLKNEFLPNSSYQLDKLDFENVRSHAEERLRDKTSRSEYGEKESNYFEFLYGYRRFEPSRGMEYLLDYREVKSGKLYRVEALRPSLPTKLDIIPVPFVRENTRIILLLPITSTSSLISVQHFLVHWFESEFLSHAKSNVILFLVVPTTTTEQQANPHDNDHFLKPEQITTLKTLVALYNSINSSDPNPGHQINRIGYAIIHLNTVQKTTSRASTIFGILDHLYQRVFNSNSLIFLVHPSSRIIRNDFLNHIRLNTISNQQIFSPIPFIQYDQKLLKSARTGSSGTHPKPLTDEINKRTGYFNTQENRGISFYFGDYYKVRKSLGTGNLSKLTSEHENDDEYSCVHNLFLQASNLHIFRSIEPNLHFVSDFRNDNNGTAGRIRNWPASQSDLAKMVFSISAFSEVYNTDDNINKFY